MFCGIVKSLHENFFCVRKYATCGQLLLNEAHYVCSVLFASHSLSGGRNVGVQELCCCLSVTRSLLSAASLSVAAGTDWEIFQEPFSSSWIFIFIRASSPHHTPVLIPVNTERLCKMGGSVGGGDAGVGGVRDEGLEKSGIWNEWQ